MWTEATTIENLNCHECGALIELLARCLRVLIREPAANGGFHYTRVTYCEECGKLYEESQDTIGDEY
jgi:uncharacterized Zn finger protein